MQAKTLRAALSDKIIQGASTTVNQTAAVNLAGTVKSKTEIIIEIFFDHDAVLTITNPERVTLGALFDTNAEEIDFT